MRTATRGGLWHHRDFRRLWIGDTVSQFGMLLVGLFVFGAAVVIYNITQVSFRQRPCPLALIGRMNATIRFIVFGAMPGGGLLDGALGSGIGVHPALLITAFAEPWCQRSHPPATHAGATHRRIAPGWVVIWAGGPAAGR